MAIPVKKGEGSTLSSSKSKSKVQFSKKGTGNGRTQSSWDQKESAEKKEGGKPRKFRRPKKVAPKKKKSDDFYDITQDKSVSVAKQLTIPEQRLLDARVAMGGFIDNAWIAQPEESSFLEGFRDCHFMGWNGIEYIGIVGGFLSTIYTGYSVLALAAIPLEEGSSSSIILKRFIFEIQNLLKDLIAEDDSRWDVIIFWLEALQEHAEALSSADVLDFQEVLGLIHNLNRWFIEYLELVLEVNEPEIVIELQEQEEELVTEESYYLPTGLFDFNNDLLPAEVNLLNALQPGVFGGGCIGRLLF